MDAPTCAMIAAMAALISGCAAMAPSAARPYPLPHLSEVESYVAQNWVTYEYRFARFARQPAAKSELISVRATGCLNYYGSAAECSFDVVARTAVGEEVRRTLSSQFQRNANGGLIEVAILDLQERRPR